MFYIPQGAGVLSQCLGRSDGGEVKEKREDRDWKLEMDPLGRMPERIRKQWIGQNYQTKDTTCKRRNLLWIETTSRKRNPHAYPSDPNHDYAEVVRNQPTLRSIKEEQWLKTSALRSLT